MVTQRPLFMGSCSLREQALRQRAVLRWRCDEGRVGRPLSQRLADWAQLTFKVQAEHQPFSRTALPGNNAHGRSSPESAPMN